MRKLNRHPHHRCEFKSYSRSGLHMLPAKSFPRGYEDGRFSEENRAILYQLYRLGWVWHGRWSCVNTASTLGSARLISELKSTLFWPVVHREALTAAYAYAPNRREGGHSWTTLPPTRWTKDVKRGTVASDSSRLAGLRVSVEGGTNLTAVH